MPTDVQLWRARPWPKDRFVFFMKYNMNTVTAVIKTNSFKGSHCPHERNSRTGHVGPARQCAAVRNSWARYHNLMSGGDVDGDIVFASMNKSLLGLAEATEASLGHLPWDALEEARKAVAKSPKLQWDPSVPRATLYVNHLVTVPTLNVRGTATLYAEIAQARHFVRFERTSL